jgi:hypothetical protein
MPITTNLSVSPYFDDFDPAKEYYKILFKPSVAVQTRELNQLQTTLQNQIERFGNNIYKRGTIIDGCNFVFYSNYPYAKLVDQELDGTPTNPANYLNHFVKNSANLMAYVLNYTVGYESTNPDLSTLYVRYINSGTSGNSSAFSVGDTLTVYESNNSIGKTQIVNGGGNFSNADSLVFVSSILVTPTSTAAFTVGEKITQSTTASRATIVSVDTSTIQGSVILGLKPFSNSTQNDLTNLATPVSTWQFSNNFGITGSSSGATGTVSDIIGSGAAGYLTTDTQNGTVQQLTITSGGSNYYSAPYLTIRQSSASAAGNYSALNLSAFNYIAQVKVSSNIDAIGNGYAFGVTSGIIYKNGYFLNVDPQTVIVTKYSNSPNNISIGFTAVESIVNYNVDPSLLDNATGTFNEVAPGADRLKIVPTLLVVNTDVAQANAEFLSIVSFSEGYPYKQNQQTQFNSISDEMARRTAESAGNFATNRFQSTSRSPLNSSVEANTFSVIVDPGQGYISGYRVETLSNYSADIKKGIDYDYSYGAGITATYGNYIDVIQLGGVFQFSTGDQVTLYDTPAYFANSSYSTGTISPVGNPIGTANIRQLIHISGAQGDPLAKYRMFLFNVKMNTGISFSTIKSVYYNNVSAGYKGIADVVTVSISSQAGQTLANSAVLSSNSKLIFQSGFKSLRAANNITYLARSLSNSSLTIGNSSSSVTTITLTSPEKFPYQNNYTLSYDDKNDITIVPLNAGLTVTPSLGGTVSANSSNLIMVGTSTTFTAQNADGLATGDYVSISANSTGGVSIRKVVSVNSDTSITLDAAPAFTNSSAVISRYYPRNVPFPIASANARDNFVINTNSTATSLNIYLNMNFTATGSSNVVITYPVFRNGVQPTSKVTNRDIFVKLSLANNVAGVAGPWCLGIPDIFRLKKVYMSDNFSVSDSDSDVTDQFYIDHNQNTDFYDHGFLYLKSKASLALSTANWLLVQLDAFTASGASLYTVSSYVNPDLATRFTNDSLPLSSLVSGSAPNTLEIPEMFSDTGGYYDLIDTIDFRPRVVNTAVLTTIQANSTINPAYTTNFGTTSDPTNDKKFPVSGTGVNFDASFFMGRADLVLVNTNNQISILAGKASSGATYKVPSTPKNSMPINVMVVPPYPGLPFQRSQQIADILSTGVASEKFSFQRNNKHTITTKYSDSVIQSYQPAGYTMANIGTLERRISALEYYVALSSLEGSIKDLTIPSSVSFGINRFKFGFFVDDFSTTKYSDLKNPEFYAAVSNSFVTPPVDTHIVKWKPTWPVAYTEYSLVSQSLATVTNVVSNVQPIIYNGIVTLLDPDYLEVNTYSKLHKMVQQIWQGNRVHVKIKGLKPSTVHSIKLDDKDVANNIIVVNSGFYPNTYRCGVLGGTFLTDTKGQIEFYMNIKLDETVLLADSVLVMHMKGATVDPGNKLFKVFNTDNTSLASFFLKPKRAVAQPADSDDRDRGGDRDNRGPEVSSEPSSEKSESSSDSSSGSKSTGTKEAGGNYGATSDGNAFA